MNIYLITLNLFKQKSHYKDTLYYLLASFSGAAIGFFLFPLYTGPLHLTPADFGIIGYTQSVNAFLVPLLQLSFSTYYIKVYFDNPPEKRSSILGSMVYFLFLWNILVIGMLLIAGELLFVWLDVKFSFYPYMFFMLVSNLFNCFYTFMLLQYRMERKPFWFMVHTLVNTVFVLGIPLLVIYCWIPGAEGRIVGFCLGSLISGLLSFLILRKKMIFRIDKELLKSAYRFSAPLIPYALIMLFYDTLDRVYIEKYGDNLSDLGYYNIAIQFSAIVYMVAVAYYRVTEADYFQLVSEDKQDVMISKMRKAVWLYLMIAVAMLLFAGVLIRMLTNASYLPSVAIIKKLVIAIFIQSCNLLIFTFLTIKARTKEMLYISIVGLVIYATAMAVLGKYMGIQGVAWSKLVLHGSILGVSLFFIKDQIGKDRLKASIFIGTVLLAILYILTESY